VTDSFSSKSKKELKGLLDSTLSSVRKQEGKYLVYRVGEDFSGVGVLLSTLDDVLLFMRRYRSLWLSGGPDLETITPPYLLGTSYMRFFSSHATERNNVVDPDSPFYKAAAVTLSLSGYNRGMLFSLANRMEHRAELIAASIPVYASEYEEQETHIMASKLASILVKDAVLVD